MKPSKRDLTRTVIIENIAPAVDGGRYAVKREVGAVVQVSADIFKEGYGVLAAFLKYRRAGETAWREAPMSHVDNDRWAGEFTLDAVGRWTFAIEALPDHFQSWLADVTKRFDDGQDVASDLLEGAAIVRAAARRARGVEARELRAAAERLAWPDHPAEAVEAARDGRLALLMHERLDRSTATWSDREYEVVVDVERARFAAWYEMFPRSGVAGHHGTFKDGEEQLARIADMGFDVVYLPPIHPIGRTHRKGKNNSLTVAPVDPGSPWAIGSEAGGHTAVHPELGTLDDFDRFVARAHSLRLEVALDFAIQCSPDHPWTREHPEWFLRRPDGTLKYAENPPKKYEDIYPVNFYGPDPRALWNALKDVVEFWIGHGVRTFRVDNPHTKPVRFWEWLIREIKDEHPDVIFLAEAFTRPKIMKVLAKAGFTQSYTYFTWRNEKQEIIDYFTEITQPPVAHYLRGSLWPNTPDILPATLQRGGRPAFRMRLVLAATLSSLYGIYSGYELCENQPVAEGSEEYLDSEKYELKVRDWDAPGNIVNLITTLNRIRRDHPALQGYTNLRFYPADNPTVLWYGKATEAKDDVIFVAVNLDPFTPKTATVEVPLEAFGLPEDAPYRLRDLLTDTTYEWRGRRGYVRLDPQGELAHVLVLER